MNVTPKLSFMKDETKVLGAGGYFLDRDNGGSMCYSGIWQDGKVVALVVDDCCDQDALMEQGNLIVKAVNAHDGLSSVVKEMMQLGDRLIDDIFGYEFLQKAKEALAAAGEPV